MTLFVNNMALLADDRALLADNMALLFGVGNGVNLCTVLLACTVANVCVAVFAVNMCVAVSCKAVCTMLLACLHSSQLARMEHERGLEKV